MGVLETPSVRGTFVLNTFDFIREHYSPAAHTMVLQMLPVPRPSLSDAGRLEVIEACPAGAILRIHDLPSATPFCQRFLGSVEGVLSLSAIPVRVEERACTCRGDGYCEIFVTREPTRP